MPSTAKQWAKVPGSRSLNALPSVRRAAISPISLGVCAMSKKQRQIGKLLDIMAEGTTDGQADFRIIRFDEEMILNEPVETWPAV